MTLFEYDILQASDCIKKGGVVLYPTDTIWGIGSDATDEKSVDRVFRIKQRETNNPMLVLVSDFEMLKNYVDKLDPRLLDYLKENKKPTTCIYPKAKNLAKNLLGPNGSIAIRVSQEDFCIYLIKNLQTPIVSTSANFSGQKYPSNFNEIDQKLINKMDYIVNYKQDDNRNSAASRIIQWKKGAIDIIRN